MNIIHWVVKFGTGDTFNAECGEKVTLKQVTEQKWEPVMRFNNNVYNFLTKKMKELPENYCKNCIKLASIKIQKHLPKNLK
jgi:hypothetical protein